MNLMNFNFDSQMLASVVGGISTLEIPKINVQNLEEAEQFVKAYGFDLKNEQDTQKLWSYHRRAVTYIKTELLTATEEIPELLTDHHQLKHLGYLLLYASTQDQRQNSLQRWACAILKVMHVYVHLENDLFTMFSSEIQDQILKPIEEHIFNDPIAGITMGSPQEREFIYLKKFDIKTFKRSDSSVTKLLAKPEAVAFTLLDKIGVRFVTKHLFDVFRVLRLLVAKNLISFPHNIPDQCNNTLYPSNIFMEVMEAVNPAKEYTFEEVDQLLLQRLQVSSERAEYKEKTNMFSGKGYQFIKFITRRLIRVEIDVKGKMRDFNFFYPFEVQIVDYETYLKNISGPSSHEEYKKRQKRTARARVLGLTETSP